MWREAAYYSKMSLGVCSVLRAPRVTDPEKTVLTQMANRERRFLDTTKKVIFTNAANPYACMFRLAGCTYEDLQEGILRDGLEPTLAALHRSGVYLSHDEFKGKKPIIRSGKTIPSSNASFINPLVSGSFQSRSGGSRSSGTVTQQSLENRLYRECYQYFLDCEFKLRNYALVGVMPILPSAWGLGQCLSADRNGWSYGRWFTVGGTMRSSGHYRTATKAMVLIARIMGADIPFPTYLKPDDFSLAAEWIARKKREGVSCWIHGMVSSSVRIAAAAVEKGFNIGGTIFRVSGEALTDAKRRVIESAGAEVFPFYHIHELGQIGTACRKMNTGNCVHVQRDAVAVISQKRKAPLADFEVNSLLFTSLLPSAARVLINADMDDAGTLGQADCDCVYQNAGFVEQISDIYSYGKLTGQGITLLGEDIVQILEEALPQKFGGTPGDYQLVEEESSHQTGIQLRVSPRTGLSSTEELKEGFLKEVRKLYGGSITDRQWRHTNALRVVVGEPYLTSTGKVLPLHLLGPGTGNAYES